MVNFRAVLPLAAMVCSNLATAEPARAQAQTAKKPNVLVIGGDDIGTENISYYNHGMMGFQTPNIDRVGR